MPYFEYFGRDDKGNVVQGKIDRLDSAEVMYYLKSRKVIPVRIEKKTETIEYSSHLTVASQFNVIKKIRASLQSKKVSDEELIMFTRQMYTVCKSGISLTEGIKNIAFSMQDSRLKQALTHIVHRLNAGASLSFALQTHTDIFNNLFISMVQVGESSGNLELIFLQLSEHIENDLEVKQSIKTATRYPLLVLFAIVTALMTMTVFIIPTFSDLFVRFDVKLPLATRVLIAISDTLVNYWWVFIVIIISAFTFVKSWFGTHYLTLLWDEKKLQLPIVGLLIKQATLARYSRSFAIMLHSGVSLNKAISLCADIVDNQFLAKKIKTIKDGVERGESLGKSHRNAGIFTPLILQMVQVGEETGAIDTLLIDVSNYYERQVRYHLKTLSSKIEPILILFMAFLVMVLSLGIFLPIWELYTIQS